MGYNSYNTFLKKKGPLNINAIFSINFINLP